MFLLYHSEGCNICELVLHECYVNDLYTTTCSGMLGHHTTMAWCGLWSAQPSWPGPSASLGSCGWATPSRTSLPHKRGEQATASTMSRQGSIDSDARSLPPRSLLLLQGECSPGTLPSRRPISLFFCFVFSFCLFISLSRWTIKLAH
jgi:hypothetical protein